MIAAFLLLTVVGIAVSVATYIKRRKLPPGARRLPGPTGLPFIGPFFSIPAQTSWIKLSEWANDHGTIYAFDMFGTHHVWITEEHIAHDLLAKRAAIYSDRPLIPSLPDNRTSGDYLALLGRSDMWKRQRKLCNNLMASSAREYLHEYPTLERDRFLYQMLREPFNYIEWIEQFTTRTVARLCWGTAQPAGVLRHVTYGLLETISPSGSLPNLMSFLRFLPASISPWQKKEGARHEMENRLSAACVAFVRESMAHNAARPSFISAFYQNQTQGESSQSSKVEEAEASHVVSLMAIAGALTIGSPIQSYVLAMVHHPEWQHRLQEEIDSTLGGRCPEWEDRHRLPLLRATMKEVIRWRPAVPAGIPHASEADDVYNGYFIPAGATIHPVEWGITRQEKFYPDPDAFNPGRWLDPNSPVYREPLDRHPSMSGFSQFGFGRRTCQGIPIVEQDLFLTMGGMAWAFDIHKSRDPVTGAEIPVPWNDYTPLLIAKPKWFPFDAVPRSRDKVARMREMHIASRRYLEAEQKMGDMDVSQFEEELGDLIYCEDVSDDEVEDADEDSCDDYAIPSEWAFAIHCGNRHFGVLVRTQTTIEPIDSDGFDETIPAVSYHAELVDIEEMLAREDVHEMDMPIPDHLRQEPSPETAQAVLDSASEDDDDWEIGSFTSSNVEDGAPLNPGDGDDWDTATLISSGMGGRAFVYSRAELLHLASSDEGSGASLNSDDDGLDTVSLTSRDTGPGGRAFVCMGGGIRWNTARLTSSNMGGGVSLNSGDNDGWNTDTSSDVGGGAPLHSGDNDGLDSESTSSDVGGGAPLNSRDDDDWDTDTSSDMDVGGGAPLNAGDDDGLDIESTSSDVGGGAFVYSRDELLHL